MDDASSTPAYYPWSFNEVIRAILRCLGLENQSQQIPSSPKKEEDGKVNSNIQAGSPESTEAGGDPPSTEQSDPPSTVTDDPPADPPSTTAPVISLSSPTRPGTSSGSGPQIN